MGGGLHASKNMHLGTTSLSLSLCHNMEKLIEMLVLTVPSRSSNSRGGSGAKQGRELVFDKFLRNRKLIVANRIYSNDRNMF